MKTTIGTLLVLLTMSVFSFSPEIKSNESLLISVLSSKSFKEEVAKNGYMNLKNIEINRNGFHPVDMAFQYENGKRTCNIFVKIPVHFSKPTSVKLDCLTE